MLIVVEDPAQWQLDIPDAEVVSARDYLTDRRFMEIRGAKVFNLCRSYGYQTEGYYVSLLAAARAHKPLPSVTTIQDMRQSSVLRIVSEDLELQLQQVLGPIKSDRFELSIYFGRNLAKRYERLAQALFNHFPAPLLRAEFVLADQWRLQSLKPIAANDIPESHHEFVVAQAQRFFASPRRTSPKRARYDLAILCNASEVDSPSNAKAIQRFIKAAAKVGIAATTIGKHEFGRLGEYDALFIRETTAVNHHTYRFASRAQAEGLVVIDDPESIVRCTNKVYQAELFDRNNIPCPRTLIIHADNASKVGDVLGYPCVLKRPDSSFSAGVVKARDQAELTAHLATMFESSDLIVAQEYVPSTFDWRVGVLDRRALFACKYHMARGHWQIQQFTSEKGRRYGKVETIPVESAPSRVVDLAVRAAGLIGRGFYGVDIKELGTGLRVVEINDNPSVDAGTEDEVLGEELYLAVMRSFHARLERRGQDARG